MHQKTNLNRSFYVNSFFFGILILFFLTLVHISKAPVPRETVLEMLPVVDKMYSGNMTIRDLLTTYAEHGMLAENIFLLLNAKLFDFSMLVEYTIAAVCIALIGYTVLTKAHQSLRETANNTQQGWMYFILFTLLVLLMANKDFAAGMSNQVRLSLLTGIITARCIDRCIRTNKWSIYGLTILVLFIAVNICGTFYTFAMMPAIMLVCAVYAARNPQRNRIQLLTVIAACILLIVLYLAEYRMMMFSPQDGGESMNNRMFAALQGMFGNLTETGKSFLAWCGASLLGYHMYIARLLSDTHYLIIGALVFGLMVFGIVLYIKEKLYRRTWVPVFLMGYSFSLFFELQLGRPMGWDWIINPWYSIHAQMMLAGCIWIYGLYFLKSKRKRPYKALFAVALAGAIALSGANIISDITYANQRKEADWEVLPYLYINSAKDMPVNVKGMTPVDAPLSITIKAINAMRQYHFGVYHYEAGYEKMLEITGGERTVHETVQSSEPALYPDHFSQGDWGSEYLSGIYEDGWAESEVKIKIHSGETGAVAINGYYPAEVNGEQAIDIYINGVRADEQYVLRDNLFTVCVYTDPLADAEIMLKMNFSGKGEGSQDARDLCFIISGIESM